jgi:hypothetical protein
MALPAVLVIKAEIVGVTRRLATQCLTPYKLFLLSVPIAVLPIWGRDYHNHSFRVGAVTGAGLLQAATAWSRLGAFHLLRCSSR